MMSVLMMSRENVNMSLIIRADNLDHEIHYSAQSDIVTRVINKAAQTKHRRRLQVRRKRRRDSVYIGIVTLLMILAASVTVVTRMMMTGAPHDATLVTGPPYTSSLAPEYQYVV